MLKQSNCVKRITASGGGDLRAEAGNSLLVKSIYCYPSASDTYLTLRVDRKTVGFYRVKGRAGNQLPMPILQGIGRNIMDYLRAQGINVTIPIAEGQILTVSRYDETGDVVVIFDRYSAGDITAERVNGTNSREYLFLQYMDCSSEVTASGDILLDTSLSPAEYPKFPCDADVPAKTKIDLLGFVGSPLGNAGNIDNYIRTTHLKLIKERETLFDEDRLGLPFRAVGFDSIGMNYMSEFSLIGSPNTPDLCVPNLGIGEPLLFEPVLSFLSGEELQIYVTLELLGTRTWTVGGLDLAAILRVKLE